MLSTMLYLLVAGLVLSVGNVNSYTNCPRTGEQYRTRCYEAVKLPMTFDEANEYCADKYEPDASLVTIPSESVNSLISHMLEDDHWIGAFSLLYHSNQHFGWVESRKPTEYSCRPSFYYTNWLLAEPSWDPVWTKDCVMMGDDGKWLMASCATRSKFVCEFGTGRYD